MASLLKTIAFGAVVRAAALESIIARPTDPSISYPVDIIPEVTQAPDSTVVRELLRRDTDQTILIGPDNTCGFIEGRYGAQYTCGDTAASCALVTASGYQGFPACYLNGDWSYVVDCRDAEQVSAGSCDGGCMNDIYTAKCTDSSAPYCATIEFNNAYTDYFCHSLNDSTPLTASTTYDGETDGRAFTVFTTEISSSSVISGASSSPSDGASINPNINSSTSSSSGISSSSSTPSSGGSKGSSSAPIGAIVGGVVGGVAVLALIVLGIWFAMRRNKKNKAAAATGATYPPMQQQSPGGPGAFSPGPMGPAGVAAGGASGYHDSMNNPPYGQQQSPGPQYPSPAPGYQPQGGAAYFSPPQEKSAGQYVTHTPSSPMTDARFSMQPSSPSSVGYPVQPQHTGGTTFQSSSPSPGPNMPSTVYEAGGDAVGVQGHNGNHHGQFHELG